MEPLAETLKPVLISMVIFGAAVVVPMVAILTEHQRKMAALLRGNQEGNVQADVAALRAEVAELRAEIARALPPHRSETNSENPLRYH